MAASDAVRGPFHHSASALLNVLPQSLSLFLRYKVDIHKSSKSRAAKNQGKTSSLVDFRPILHTLFCSYDSYLPLAFQGLGG